MSSLFRKEAVEHQKDRLMGDVVLLQPLPLAIMTLVAVLIAMMIVGLLFWGTYARKQTVRGYLEPETGIVRVYPPSSGTVQQVHVKEGQHVKAGDPLVTITTERSMESGEDVDTLLLQEIDKDIIDIDNRIKAEKDLESKELKRLASQVEGLNEELKQIEEALNLHEERLKLSQERVDAHKQLLEKNMISQKDFDKIQEDHLQLRQQHQDLKRAQTTKRNALVDANAQLDQLPLQVQTKISSLEKEKSDLRQRRYEIEGRRVFEIRAPIDGTVDGLSANAGQYLNPQGSNILAIIPEDAHLRAELYVPTRAIGFIEVGQKVKIRYDAFPHQRYGVYEGTIDSISTHILDPREINAPVDIQEPVYRVIVVLTAQFVTAYGKQMPLQPGMSLEADIIIERQSLLDWILDPLYSIKGKL